MDTCIQYLFRDLISMVNPPYLRGSHIIRSHVLPQVRKEPSSSVSAAKIAGCLVLSASQPSQITSWRRHQPLPAPALLYQCAVWTSTLFMRAASCELPGNIKCDYHTHNASIMAPCRNPATSCGERPQRSLSRAQIRASAVSTVSSILCTPETAVEQR